MSAGELLRLARTSAGLTLRQVADRTGVAESRLSDYERGRHQPSAAMLARLLEATGHQLVARRRPGPDPFRNGAVLADLLSFVDAVPFSAMHERSGRTRARPPTWAEVLSAARRR
ncbi:MAG TPA: helix-turn-helix transcriptional regulator [Acidimicrobiales bacterium]|nr:helix-turn-helix transcriptional regulator [Acidimicrobiales bacterium]